MGKEGKTSYKREVKKGIKSQRLRKPSQLRDSYVQCSWIITCKGEDTVV